MEITVKSFEPKEAMNAYIRDQEEKHLYKGFKAVTFDGEKMIELVDLRIGATASTSYACVWFKSDKKWAYGSGKAGGYGYDKGSAAAEAAFRAAWSMRLMRMRETMKRETILLAFSAIWARRTFTTI